MEFDGLISYNLRTSSSEYDQYQVLETFLE